MLKDLISEEKYNTILERNRDYKKTERGLQKSRESYARYYNTEAAKKKKQEYYLKKKEEKILKYIEENGEEPIIRGRGRPKKM